MAFLIVMLSLCLLPLLASVVSGAATTEDYKDTYYERASYAEHQISYKIIEKVS